MRCVVGAVLLLLQMVAERRGIIIHLLLLIYMFQLPPWYWQCFGCYIKEEVHFTPPELLKKSEKHP